MTALAARHHELAPLYSVKRLFVQRRAMNRIKPEEAAQVDGPALEAQLAREMGGTFSELGFAQLVTRWQQDEAAARPGPGTRAALRRVGGAHAGGPRAASRGMLFKAPGKLDYFHLVPLQSDDAAGFRSHRLDHLRRREGFALTDPGTDLVGALDQANYCIWCHEQGRDSCSHGLKEKAPADGAPAPFKKTVFGVPLAGCPLEEKISEFHKVKTEGNAVGALAIITVDNPDGGGDRAPHLQRLHEVVHLPEAGAGQHPAGGNAHAEGRAGAALGLRDLLAAHALEPARPAAPVPAAAPAASACWSSAWGRPDSPWRIT